VLIGDPTTAGAAKDFVPLGTAAIGAAAGFLIARLQDKREDKRLELEREAVRVALYDEYLTCLGRFYEPGERTRRAYSDWSTSYSRVSTKIEFLGLKSIRTPVQGVTDLLDRLQGDHLTDIDDMHFGSAWYEAVRANQAALDTARQRVIDAIEADVGSRRDLGS
jgi:hypothetical protein